MQLKQAPKFQNFQLHRIATKLGMQGWNMVPNIPLEGNLAPPYIYIYIYEGSAHFSGVLYLLNRQSDFNVPPHFLNPLDKLI